jgi:PKD repeat protein/murein DD-endopeptidase MepM/ murein hydrolase activator NlpD
MCIIKHLLLILLYNFSYTLKCLLINGGEMLKFIQSPRIFTTKNLKTFSWIVIATLILNIISVDNVLSKSIVNANYNLSGVMYSIDNSSFQYQVADSFRFPLDGAWMVLLDFGEYYYDPDRFSGKHLGEDAKAPALTSLYAIANGVVKHNTYVNGYMNVVIIEHTLPDNSKVTSVYGHMTSDGIIPVGTEVSKGQYIGKLDTAESFSANNYIQHLHFGIRKGAYTSTWVYFGYEKGSETIDNWYDPTNFILSHSGGQTNVCPSPSSGNPKDNVILNNNQITFSWTPPSCDGLDSYTFRVSNHADIDNQPWIIDHGVNKDSTSITETIPSQYNGQTLYWAIWPHSSAGYGSKGGPWSFKIDTSTPPPPPPLPTGNWSVQYFRNKELTDQCNTTSFDRTFIFQDWGEGAPASGCNSDNWGARFTRRVNFQGGNYSFAVEADDWGRIYVDNNLYVDKWNGASQHYEGHYVSPGDHDVRVEFADTMGGAKISAWWWGPGFDIPHEAQDPNQWYANYWINPTQWWDAFASKNEGSGLLNHDWGTESPGWDMPSDNFSAKFQRTVNFECGTYRFIMNHDDGARLWIDDVLKVDRWIGTIGYYTIDLPISQGTHLLQVDQYENGGAANISFDWQKISGCNPSAPSLQTPSNSSNLVWNTDLTLLWNSSSGATQYFAQLQGGPGVDINSGWVSGTQWYIGNLWPGVYTWAVTARNDYGSSLPSSTWTFTIQEPPSPVPAPSAEFDASPQSGNAPLTVALHIVNLSNISSCSWDYGDGQTSTTCAQYHNHTYTSIGNYSVKLIVDGPGGTDFLQRDGYIQVGQPQTCYTLTTSVSPAGSGSISLNPTPNCNGSQYIAGTVVQVTANSHPGYTFNRWSGDLGGSITPTNLNITTNKAVTANFTSIATNYWRGEYYSNANLSGTPALVRDDFLLNLDWGLGSPDPTIPADNFSVRWTRPVYFLAGNYRFHLEHDDGGRLYIDGSLKINNWSQCCTWDQQDVTLSEGIHILKVEMTEISGAANLEFWWEQLDISGWRGEYFNNPTLFERPTIVRNDPEINFSWYDQPPDPLILGDGFSVRWTRSVYFPQGMTTFHLYHDDGARLYVDGTLILDNWCSSCMNTDTAQYTLSAGYHTVIVEMYENSGWSGANLWMENNLHKVFLPHIQR